MRALAVVLLLALSAGPSFAVQPDEVLADAGLEARARDISRDLRCPVCQGENIDESNAPISRDLRLYVRERLVAVLEAQRPAEVNDVIILDILREVSGAYTLLKNDAEGMKRREMRARIQEIKKEVTYDKTASSAVKAVVEEAAAVAAVVATSAAITTT